MAARNEPFEVQYWVRGDGSGASALAALSACFGGCGRATRGHRRGYRSCSCWVLGSRSGHRKGMHAVVCSGKTRNAPTLPKRTPPLERKLTHSLCRRAPPSRQLYAAHWAQRGATPLIAAAFDGHYEWVLASISGGADCEERDNVRCCRRPRPPIRHAFTMAVPLWLLLPPTRLREHEASKCASGSTCKCKNFLTFVRPHSPSSLLPLSPIPRHFCWPSSAEHISCLCSEIPRTRPSLGGRVSLLNFTVKLFGHCLLPGAIRAPLRPHQMRDVVQQPR